MCTVEYTHYHLKLTLSSYPSEVRRISKNYANPHFIPSVDVSGNRLDKQHSQIKKGHLTFLRVHYPNLYCVISGH